MTTEKYIPDFWKPESESLVECYPKALEELSMPFPSVKLNLFSKLSTMTGGLRPYEFSILCGATGCGKTTLCANLSCDLLLQKVPQFIASVETGHTDYVKRMISAFSGEDWNAGDQVNADRLHEFNKGFGEMFTKSGSHLSLYDNRTSIENLMADMAYMVSNHGVKVAFIDNLNFFLEITTAQNAIVEMDRVIHELIIFCKQVPIHVVMVMHPKKTDGGRVESEFDIKGSSTAVQEAHNVFLFNRAHPDLIKTGVAGLNDREIMIAKMRRRGRFVRRRLMIGCQNGSKYFEGDVL